MAASLITIGMGTYARINGSSWQGMKAGVPGQHVILYNYDSGDATLVHVSGAETGADFYCPGATDFQLRAGQSTLCVYDGTDAVWRVIDSLAG